jgi:hypothetical protein
VSSRMRQSGPVGCERHEETDVFPGIAYSILVKQKDLHLRSAGAGAPTGDILALRDYLRDVALYALDDVHCGRVCCVAVY